MNIKKVLKVALGTGLFLLDQPDEAKKQARNRISDQVDDLRDERKTPMRLPLTVWGVPLMSSAEKTTTDRCGMRSRLIAGIGIGIGVGLLIAPANGDQTRTMLADKAQEFGDNVRQRFGMSDLRPTGTGD